jgi:hypothetical protein
MTIDAGLVVLDDLMTRRNKLSEWISRRAWRADFGGRFYVELSSAGSRKTEAYDD